MWEFVWLILSTRIDNALIWLDNFEGWQCDYGEALLGVLSMSAALYEDWERNIVANIEVSTECNIIVVFDISGSGSLQKNWSNILHSFVQNERLRKALSPVEWLQR